MPTAGRAGKVRRSSAVSPVALRLTKRLPLCLLSFYEERVSLRKLSRRIPYRERESTGLNATAWPQSVFALSTRADRPRHCGFW